MAAGGAGGEGALGEGKGIVEAPGLVVSEGVLAEECPVVPVAGLELLKHGIELFGEVLHAGAATSEEVETVGDAHHYGVAGELVEVLKGDGEGLGAVAVDEEGDAFNVALLAAGRALY